MGRLTPLALSSLALAVPRAFAQLTPTWERRVPLATNDARGYGQTVLLADGSVVFAGTSMATGTSSMALTRFAADGTQLWSRTYSPSANHDTAVDLALDPQSGDLLVVGVTRAVGATQSDMRVTRVSASGALSWTTTSSSGTFDAGRRVCVDSAGATWVLWEEVLTGAPQLQHVFVTGFTPTGSVLASLTLLDGGSGSSGMSAHPAGGVVLAYDSPSMQTVYRIDGAGNVLWNSPLTSFGAQDAERRVVCDAAGNAFVCGNTPAGNAVISKYAPAGNVLWTCTHVAPAGIEEELTALAVDSQGNVVGVGSWIDWGNYVVKTFIVRCTSSGALSWTRTSFTGGGEMDSFGDVVLDPAGHPTAIGASGDPLSISGGLLVRYDRDGTERAIARRPAPAGTSTFFQGVAAGSGDSVVGGIDYPDAILVRFHEQGVPFCLGDGSGTACPCGNTSATYDQSGCRYNASAASHLVDLGVARVGADTVVLEVRGAPASGPVIFVQGDQRANGGAGIVYGDGLLCVAGNIVRLGSVTANGGIARLGAGFSANVSVLGHVSAPGVLTYQAVHRSHASFCTPATMGSSNGSELTWSP